MINLKTKDWTINNVETILFDKDGTFIDLHYFWGKMTELRAKETIQHFCLPDHTVHSLCKYLGYNTQTKKMEPDGITALYSRSQIIELYKNDLKNLNITTTNTQIEKIFDKVSQEFYKDMTKYTKPIKSAINFIKEIKQQGIKTGIVTSDAKESTDLTLKNFGWENLFDIVIGRESSAYTKESGIPTIMALKELQANPKTTVMIGDAPMDYISAKNAGINNVILVATGQIEKNELFKTNNYVLDSLDKITIFP